MRCRLFAAFLLFPAFATATESLFVDSRYQVLQARTDEQLQTVGFVQDRDTFQLAGFARLTHSGLNANSFDYAFDASYFPLSWFHLNGRIAHQNRFNELGATSTGLAVACLEGHWPEFLSYFFELGLYQRLHLIGTGTWLPPVLSFSYADWGYTFAMGLRVHPNERWSVQAKLASYEFLDVYNINHMFVETSVFYNPGPWNAKGYVRYQGLLGFGQRDAWVIGLQLSFVLPTLRRRL